jgi:ribulose 1,5-bisphosphate carboxylase large subunit-like protein
VRPIHKRPRHKESTWTSRTATPTSASGKRPHQGRQAHSLRLQDEAEGRHGYLEAAAHFAAESSTGTNVEVSTTDEFTKGVDALVYHIDEAAEDMRIAYPLDLFDRNITDGRMMIVSFLTLTIGNNQGMGDIEYAKMSTSTCPERAIQLFDGPAKDISDLWRILGRPVKDGGYISGTIIKPKLGLRPEPFAKAAYEFWLGGDFIKNDEPQGNQVFAPLKKTIPLVYDAMKRAMDETGEAKLFSANITADDHYEMSPAPTSPGDLRPRCRQGGLPGRRLCRRPRHGHHRASPVPRTSTCTTTAPATAPSPRPRPSAATPPSCWPR